MGTITVSIVSHGHGQIVLDLLSDLESCPEIRKVILTRNIPENFQSFDKPDWVEEIVNSQPRGFGANHNAAFKLASTPYFLVLNPDIRLESNPFPELLLCMKDSNIGLCAPAVVGPQGNLEDSARYYPTISGLVRKMFGRGDGRLDYQDGDPPSAAPWLAGMFLLIRSSDYVAIGGFDEGFFLYYEDVDLCARMWKGNRRVLLCPTTRVIHDARRASRHNLRHMRWHAASMLRYFRKHPLRPELPPS